MANQISYLFALVHSNQSSLHVGLNSKNPENMYSIYKATCSSKILTYILISMYVAICTECGCIVLHFEVNYLALHILENEGP